MLRLFILSSIFTVVACSSPPDNRSSADAGTDKLPNTGLSSTKDAASPNETLSFAPSNLAGIVFSNANSVKIDGQCTFDTDAGSVDCDSDEAIQFHVVTQSDANRTVFVAESLTIGPDAVVTVVGTRPIAIVTRGEILIQGSLQAIPDSRTGNGGGAVQLVSGSSITLAPLAKINVGGGGGQWLGGGGGSGGAVLLEAPTVTVQGVIAANGGSGGANSIDADASGYTGTPNATAAPGGTNPSTPVRTPAAAARRARLSMAQPGNIQTPSGNVPMGAYGGGGGGGAGRIRINTNSGSASITGVLSPSAGTSCVSQGKLLPSG